MDEATAKAIAGQLRKPEGEDGIKTGNWMNKGNSRMNLDTIRLLDPVANDRILEIGMGNGFFVNRIVAADPSIRYTGIDFSSEMVNEAKQTNKDWISKGQADFIHGTVSKTPFTDQAFNKVFTINTIYFWENPVTILGELKRILQPGGRLIIAIRPKYEMEKYPFTKYGFTLYSKEELEKLLLTHGFSSIQSFLHKEPAFEIEGEKLKMENLVAIAVKN